MPDWAQYVRQNLRLSHLQPEREAEIVEDLAGQLDQAYCEALECGLTQGQAEAAAMRHVADWASLANELAHSQRGKESAMAILQHRAEDRDAATRGRFSLLTDLRQDVRFALRMLRKSPGFTAVAVLTLALGIGANTAIFSAVNGIWLEPRLKAHFSRMVTVDLLSISEIHAIQKQSTAFKRTAIYQGYSCLVLGGGVPVQAMNGYVSDDFFPMLGVKPLLGRYILPADTEGNDRVAVLSYGLWMDDFGGDRQIIGRRISVDGKPYTVIGVMPKGFVLGVTWGGSSPGLWMPSAFPLSDPTSHGRFSSFVARLKSGVTVGQVRAQLNAVYARLEAEYPRQYPSAAERYGRYGWIVTPGIQGRPSPVITFALFILLGAVGFVLLMACVNVASLLVARSWTRQREMAIRIALGATRRRIAQQLLSESLVLALAGGMLGALLSVWGVRVLRIIAPPGTPRAEYIRVDSNVLWFTLGISLLAAVLVGLAPALQAASRRAGSTLKGGLAGSFAEVSLGRSHRIRSALVVLEVTLALIVVTGGALMMRSFYELMHVNTGVRADHVITMSVQLSDQVCNNNASDSTALKRLDLGKLVKLAKKLHVSGLAGMSKQELMLQISRYESATKCALANINLLNGVRLLPGVERAALADSGPFQGGSLTTSSLYPGEPSWDGLYIEGRTGNQLESGDIEGRSVTPGFFAAMGIHLLKGRDFRPTDANRHDLAIVSQGFAQEYIPGDPLGKRFSVGEDANGHRQWVEIVGEVNDVRDRAVEELASGPVYYTPFYFLGSSLGEEIIVRASMDPVILVPAIERIIRSVDSNAPITHVETVDQIIAQSAAEPRFQTFLLSSFGALGLLLAVIGVYGVVSFSAVQRTQEIGVRMALGAQRGDVLRMMIREGMVLAGAGIAFGIGAALTLTRFLRSMLFEIKPTDPVTCVGVAVLLAIVALAACYIPARRAMRIDPMVALRYE
jgi:putative ABC transport system permease protein